MLGSDCRTGIHIDTKWIQETILDPDWTEVDLGILLLSADFAPFLSLADAFFAWHVSRQIRAFAL